MTCSQRGAAGEAAVLAAFTRLGVPVFFPFGDGCAADLIADVGDTPKRVQVKSAVVDSAGGATFDLRRGGHSRNARRYGEEEIDWFALYTPNRPAVLLVRRADVGDMARLRIRFVPAGGKRRADVHYAEDYRIDRVVADEMKGLKQNGD